MSLDTARPGKTPHRRGCELRLRAPRRARTHQIISREVASEGTIGIVVAAGLEKPDISILSDESFPRCAAWSGARRNLAGELLQRLLKRELAVRPRKDVVQGTVVRRDAGTDAAPLPEPRRRSRPDDRGTDPACPRHAGGQRSRGEHLGPSDDEVAFHDALETNDSAVQVLGDETLRDIARELVDTVRRNVTIDWTLRENVRASLVKRIQRKQG